MNASASRSILIPAALGYRLCGGGHPARARLAGLCDLPPRDADCARLDSEGFESFRIDYELPETIAAGAEEALQRTGGNLDALYNNGAYAIPGAVEDLPVEALRILFEANFFGWHDLTRRVLPAMRRQGKGRIVQCSSVLGFIGLPMRGAYVATKIRPGRIEPYAAAGAAGHGHPCFADRTRTHRDQIRRELQAAFPELDRPRKHPLAGGLCAAPAAPRRELPPLPSTLPAGAVVDKLVHALESPRPRPRYYVTRSTYLAGYAQRLFSTRWLTPCSCAAGSLMSGILLVVALLAVFAVLMLGIGQFAFGRPDPRRSNRLMRLRVVAQGIALVLLLGALAFSAAE